MSMCNYSTCPVHGIVAYAYSKYTDTLIAQMYVRDLDVIDNITKIINSYDYSPSSYELRNNIIAYLCYYNNVNELYPRDMRFVHELIYQLQLHGYVEPDMTTLSMRDKQFLTTGVVILISAAIALYLLVNWL